MSSRDARPSPTVRLANLALLVLLPLAVVTGLVANTAGTTWGIHPSVFHGIVALGVLFVTPWKQISIRRGLRRNVTRIWLSLLLLAMVLATLTTGFAHVLGYRGPVGPLTVMQVHIGAGLAALLLVVVHYRAHPVRFRAALDMERRALLRTLILVGGATVGWVGLERGVDALGLPGGTRRFTGSHERGSFRPDHLPVTSWLDDSVPTIDSTHWVVTIDGHGYDLTALARLPTESFDAVLDCTSAWYSEQTWTGVRLDRLVGVGDRRSIVVRSHTGYSRRFPASDVAGLWLVTAVGGEPLAAEHGAPARVVAPGRRGFWWVKWVVAIDTSDVPWWVQSPYPVT